jgi:outer membrane protein assembly factor BamB
MHLAKAVALCLLAASVHGADVPGWRGLDGSGVYPDATPPVTWSKTNGVAWRVALAKWSNASPMILGDRLVICEEPATVLCLKLADGSLLWKAGLDYTDLAETPEAADKIKAGRAELEKLEPARKKAEQALRKAKDELKKTPADEALKAAVAEADKKLAEANQTLEPYKAFRTPETHPVAGYSTPTPVTDGKTIYVLTGLGTLAAYTPDGKRLWAREVGRPKHGWGHSTSPFIRDNGLFIHFGNKLTCLDPATGAERWSADSASSWGPLGFVTAGPKKLVITPAGDWFDIATGAKTASKVQPFPWNGPAVSGQTVFKLDENGASACAVNEDGTAKELWKTAIPKKRYYASAIIHDGLAYNVHQDGGLVVLDTKDGSLVYSQNLDLGGGTCYPSPFLANGLIYASSDNGRTIVFKPGRTFEQVAKNTLEPFRSNPVPHGKTLFIRTLTELVCLGQ